MLLGHFRGSQEAGLYRLATTLVTAGSYPEASLGRVVYPALAGQWATGDRGIVRRRLVRWTFREGLIAGTLVFATIPLLPLVVPPVFGTDFGAMVFGTQIMMLGAVISAVFFWLTSFYYASGRIDSWTKAYAVYMALVTGLTWLVVQRWGFSGVAVLVGLGKATFAASMVVPVLFLKGALRESIRMPQSGRNGKVLCDSSGVSIHLERPST
jgi:O-antigen/teichoic acid export membrane protein